MDITIYRHPPLAEGPGLLPVATCNLPHTLLVRSPGVLFVPIRGRPFLAIFNAEETASSTTMNTRGWR